MMFYSHIACLWIVRQKLYEHDNGFCEYLICFVNTTLCVLWTFRMGCYEYLCNVQYEQKGLAKLSYVNYQGVGHVHEYAKGANLLHLK